MKTDHLIEALAGDTRVAGRYDRALLVAVLVGSAIATAIFFTEIGLRRNIAEVAETLRFQMKFVVAIALGVAALGLAWRIGRPGIELKRWWLALLAAPLLLGLAVGMELVMTPQGEWMTRLVGRNARWCLYSIPILAIGPLVCLLLALRQGAPERPALAGAVAGLAASAIAATLYAAHCSDDSPLFVATWYVLATAIVVGMGAIAGSRVLRW